MLCCFYTVTFAQTTISGSVSLGDAAIAQASVRILLPTDSSIVAYGFTDSDGKFSLKVNSNEQSLLLFCTHLSYGEHTQLITNKDQQVVVQLGGKPLEIPEVKVEAPKLQIKGDTLTYLLNAYANQKDRTLADVLKKLPGVEVDMNGAIKYKGRYINKFYVEGKDLMETRYGVITNAMPNQDVQSVEILHNHQPIKMLEGKIPSQEAAFNIKLKKSVSLSGRAQVGLGASPFLWDTKITPMLFSKKYQMLADLKSNNVGDDILASYDVINVSMGFMQEDTKPIRSGDILQTNRPTLPNLASTTYLDNRSHLFSANLLKNLAKDWEVKFNVDAWYQRVNDYGQEHTQIILDEEHVADTLAYTERITNSFRDKNLKGSILINQNGKNNYLKNRFTFQFNEKSNSNETDLNENVLSQQIKSLSWALQNTLNGIKRFGTAQNIQLSYYSHINYLDNDYDYALAPSRYFEIPQMDMKTDQSLLQTMRHKTLETNHYVSTRFFGKIWNIEPRITVKTNSSTLKANLFSEGKSISYNDNDINNVSILGAITSRLRLNKIDIALLTPLHFAHTDVQTTDYKLQEKKLFFEPTLEAKWRIGSFWEWLVNGSRQEFFGNTSQVYDYIIMNASSFQTYPVDLSTQRNYAASTQWKYANPLKSIHANLTINHNDTQRDFI